MKHIIRIEKRTDIQNSIGRLAISALSFIIQVIWLCFIGLTLKKYSVLINSITSIIALLLAIWVFNRNNTNSNFKMPWIMLILAFPILGICLFVVFGPKYSIKDRKRMNEIHNSICSEMLSIDNDLIHEVEEKDKGIANQLKYLSYIEGFPLYKNSEVIFFDEASNAYKELIDEVSKAKNFIYMEYFAIEANTAFKSLYDILIKKIEEGVEVRILYDDIGSIGFVNNSFSKKLEEVGIHCRAFNRISPAFRLYMNNRDHRKICIVDGIVAFTGGYNIADEYFNIVQPYGYWKDTGIKIKGKAVNSLLCMFLEMWNSTQNEVEDIEKYQSLKYLDYDSKGYILPYSDSPLDDSRVGENVYINLINNAKEKVYITTPYLVISDEFQRTLQMAACRGIDVRIVTPGMPDKKVTYRLTRSYYKNLIKYGVKIYEYTPGFIHAKQVIVDNDLAVVGTINMDYRSLFHHFENAVLMYDVEAINDIKKDFDNLFCISKLINNEQLPKKKISQRILGAILRLFAPLI